VLDDVRDRVDVQKTTGAGVDVLERQCAVEVSVDITVWPVPPVAA
jgi:hypothetical protein